MFKGFYNLTSAMLTQQRNINVVGNNIVNVSTAGFKQDRYTATTFDDVMYSRVGNRVKDYEDIGRQSYIRANSMIYTDYTEGIPEPTDIPLDFAIHGDGFFAVQTENDGIYYTRMGTFSLDDEGGLWLSDVGRVLDNNGAPIILGTDKIEADSQGNIFRADGGYLATLGVYTFEDNADLRHNAQGFFVGDGAQAANEGHTIYWKYIERSNTDMVQQMTEMMTCQRAFQSAGTVSKIYDQVMTRAATEIGRL